MKNEHVIICFISQQFLAQTSLAFCSVPWRLQQEPIPRPLLNRRVKIRRLLLNRMVFQQSLAMKMVLFLIEHADADPAQNNPAVAAEHALVNVLLQQAVLADLQWKCRRNRLALHDEAPELLQWPIKEEPDDPVDLIDKWPTWREYIAMHKDAHKLVGPGVIALTGAQSASVEPSQLPKSAPPFSQLDCISEDM